MTDIDEDVQHLDITDWEAARVNGDGTSYEVPDEGEGSRTVTRERAPKIPHQSMIDRVKAIRERKMGTGLGKPVAKKVGKPRVSHPRVSTANIVEWGWGMLSRMAQPLSVPVARTLALQAPVAGDILDDVIRNTVADRLLQPLARMTEGSEAVVALLGPPVIVGVMHKNPAMVPALEPLLRKALMSWVRIAGPRMQERAEEETRFEAEYGNTVNAIMEGIFAGIGEPEENESVVTMPMATVPPPESPTAPEPVTPEFVATMPHPMKAPTRPSQRSTRVPPIKRAPVKKVATAK